MSNKIPLSVKEKMEKSVKNAGNTLFALGIFTPLMTLLYYALDSTPIGYIVFYVVIAAAFFVPLIIVGGKIKNDKFENLMETSKRVSQMIIYTIILIFVGLILGVLPGIFAIIAVVELFSAKKQIKEYVS